MGLDVYSGTLTRYYSGNWKSIVQQMAEANGYSFSRITPEGDPIEEEAADPVQIQKEVEDWRDWLLKAISREGQKPYEPWAEDNEKPYYTDKPDWDAFGALLLYAACAMYGEGLPPTVEKGWDFWEHPVMKRITEDKEKQWSLFAGAIWWLPLEDCLYFNAPRPSGDTVVIGTTGLLKAELDKINELGWKADEETILGWLDTEGYPMDGEILENGVYKQTGPVNKIYDTQSLAKFAFSILYRAVTFSAKNRVPVLLDY